MRVFNGSVTSQTSETRKNIDDDPRLANGGRCPTGVPSYFPGMRYLAQNDASLRIRAEAVRQEAQVLSIATCTEPLPAN